VALQPIAGHDLIFEVGTSSTTTPYSRYDSTGLLISSSQRPVPDVHKRPTSMPPTGFEPTISADERPQTCATGTGRQLF